MFPSLSSVQDAFSQKFIDISKKLYDFGNLHCPIQGLSGGLPELYTEGFDEEQIWQQIELHNEAAFQILLKNAARIQAVKGKMLSFKKTDPVSRKVADDEEVDEEEEINDDDSVTSNLSFQLPAESGEEDESDPDDFGELDLDDYKVLEDGEDGNQKDKSKKNLQPKAYKKTEVDDQFFKLREMEEFLQKEETEKKQDEEEDDDDDDSIDLFEEIPTDDEEQVVCPSAIF